VTLHDCNDVAGSVESRESVIAGNSCDDESSLACVALDCFARARNDAERLAENSPNQALPLYFVSGQPLSAAAGNALSPGTVASIL
jgi:hypothetical protein